MPEDKSDIIRAMKKASWWTSIHAAVINNELALIQSYEYSESDITPLDLAIMIGNLDAVRALIERRIQYDINTCLIKAIFSNRHEVARLFLEKGANPSYYPDEKKEHTAFHIAAATNNHTILRLLTEFYRFSLFNSKKCKLSSDNECQDNINRIKVI